MGKNNSNEINDVIDTETEEPKKKEGYVKYKLKGFDLKGKACLVTVTHRKDVYEIFKRRGLVEKVIEGA